MCVAWNIQGKHLFGKYTRRASCLEPIISYVIHEQTVLKNATIVSDMCVCVCVEYIYYHCFSLLILIIVTEKFYNFFF